MTKYKGVARTDYLFARPSFARGFARGLDLFGTLNTYNTSATGAESDSRAIAADWSMVWQDLQGVLERAESR